MKQIVAHHLLALAALAPLQLQAWDYVGPFSVRQDLNAITYAHGRYLIVGAGGIILSSDNGGTIWTQHSVAQSTTFRDVRGFVGGYLALSVDGKLLQLSPDLLEQRWIEFEERISAVSTYRESIALATATGIYVTDDLENWLRIFEQPIDCLGFGESGTTIWAAYRHNVYNISLEGVLLLKDQWWKSNNKAPEPNVIYCFNETVIVLDRKWGDQWTDYRGAEYWTNCSFCARNGVTGAFSMAFEDGALWGTNGKELISSMSLTMLDVMSSNFSDPFSSFLAIEIGPEEIIAVGKNGVICRDRRTETISFSKAEVNLIEGEQQNRSLTVVLGGPGIGEYDFILHVEPSNSGLNLAPQQPFVLSSDNRCVEVPLIVDNDQVYKGDRDFYIIIKGVSNASIGGIDRVLVSLKDDDLPKAMKSLNFIISDNMRFLTFDFGEPAPEGFVYKIVTSHDLVRWNEIGATKNTNWSTGLTGQTQLFRAIIEKN